LILAAYKFEQKRGRDGCATTAFHQLEEIFDVLITGDGKIAVFEALEDNNTLDGYSPSHIDYARPIHSLR
jgi:hypothetical protein